MATTESPDAGVDGPTDYLVRNADVVDVEHEREQRTESWERAIDAGREGRIDERDGRGRYEVELPDGSSPHDVLAVRSDDDLVVGACDCDGWIMHGSACAHLCTLAQWDVVDDLIPHADTRAQTLLEERDVEDDQDDDRPDRAESDGGRDVQEESDDVQEDDTVDAEPVETPEPVETTPSKPDAPDQPQGSDVEDRPAEPDPVVKPVETVSQKGPIEAAPEWAKSEIQERGGDLDLNKDGCQFVAAMLGIDTDREFRVRAEDNDFEFAIVECTATLGHRSVTREATAHIDESNVEKHDMNRMAETRAFKRAVKSISGGGLAAFASSD